MILIYILISILVSAFVFSPLFLRYRDFSEVERLTFEKQDLVRVLESLEFDLERGLISQNEYDKQKHKAYERIKLIDAEVL
jgi:hypothetical protein